MTSNNGRTADQPRGPLPIAQTVLTVHCLYDLPREMQQQDPRREQFELVVRPVVKYDYQERRITVIPLGERVMPFASSAILFRGERFVLDFDNTATPGGTIAAGSPHGSPGQRWRTTGEEEENEWEEENDNNNDNNNNNNNNNNCGDDSGVLNGNQVLLQYPSPAAISTVIDVTVGIRQHRIGSSVIRWITGNLDTSTHSDGIGYFSVATEEVRRKKAVARVVGLSVGGAIFSLSVNPHDDKNCILDRLLKDKSRYMKKYHENMALASVDVADMLRNGFSEEEIHRNIRLLADPHYYLRRLENLLSLYPSNKCPEWREGGKLLEMYASREEELMRRAILEVGPECCNVSSRHRLLAYRKKYILNEQTILTCLQSVVEGSIHEKLLTEPEIIFDALTKQFGREPRPTSYLFPTQTYTPDRRTFFFETLQFPINRSGEKYRDVALALRNKRVPFTMSPCERPLHSTTSSSSSRPGEAPSEIEILREKYAPEFSQIVPSIANALQAVVEQNRKLSHYPAAAAAAAGNTNFQVFQQQGMQPRLSFQDFVHRTAEYTFISPSTLLGAIIYLDRLCLRHPSLVITDRNVLRLFLTSVRVASKTLELRSINNRHFADVYGLDTKSLNVLEEIFVKGLQFDLFLSPEEFGDYARVLHPPNAYQIRALSKNRGYINTTTAGRAEAMTQISSNAVDIRKKSTSNIIVTENNNNDNNNNGNSNSTTKIVGAEKRLNPREITIDATEHEGNAVLKASHGVTWTEGDRLVEHSSSNKAEASPRKHTVSASVGSIHSHNTSNNNNSSNNNNDNSNNNLPTAGGVRLLGCF